MHPIHPTIHATPVDPNPNLFCVQLAVDASKHLTYSTGPRGSLRLRRAVATFLQKEFRARRTITQDDIVITSGLTSALDSITWAICNEGDSILIPTPFYNGFHIDLTARSNAKVVGVTWDDIRGFSGFDDMFRPEFNRAALEAALCRSKKAGIEPRALLISK